MDHHLMMASALESTVDIALTESRDDFDSQITAIWELLGKSGTITLSASDFTATILRLKDAVLNHIEAIPSETDAAYESLKHD